MKRRCLNGMKSTRHKTIQYGLFANDKKTGNQYGGTFHCTITPIRLSLNENEKKKNFFVNIMFC